MMMRVDDARLAPALAGCLRQDPDPLVRARVAQLAGLHMRRELADALLDASTDTAGVVRREAVLSLGALESRLSEAQRERLDGMLQSFLVDPESGVRREGLIRAERVVAQRMKDAERALLEGRVAGAESLYSRAAQEFPSSQRARYRLGRHHYDDGDALVGLGLLRQGRVLLDVPRLSTAPRIDGRLDDPAWQEAARADSFFSLSFEHEAALPAKVPTIMHVGYTDEAVYLAFRCHDDRPDSLVALYTQEMADAATTIRPGFPQPGASIWRDDVLELFIDPGFDRSDYSHLGINSLAVIVDDWINFSRREARARGVNHGQTAVDRAWDADDALAVEVGADHWTVEYRFGYDEHHPRPSPGTVWGFNAVRVYRGQEYSQWIRTYDGGHSPNQFGLLLFQ
jgi:hypothetical protein